MDKVHRLVKINAHSIDCQKIVGANKKNYLAKWYALLDYSSVNFYAIEKTYSFLSSGTGAVLECDCIYPHLLLNKTILRKNETDWIK